MEPNWLTQARHLLGIREVAGDGNNLTIISWAEEIGGWVASYYKQDSIPWCGLFVGICMKRSEIPLPANALGARNWATWGQHLTTAVPGAVMVFERPGGGHVAFYVGEDEDSYHTLGGNQSDSVDIARMPKTRLLAVRWPDGITPYGEPVHLTPDGKPLSTNEA